MDAAAQPPAADDLAVPLCVDLDGTLLRTDMLWESFTRLLRQNPLWLLVIPFWWARGRAFLKRQLAARTRVEVATLPVHGPFLAFLQREKARGRRLLLVTASDRAWGEAVARQVPLFDEVLASDGAFNLRGANKVARLVERFGERGFDYAGNSTVDLPVWQRARRALVVNASEALARRAAAVATLGPKFTGAAPFLGPLLRALRPHQWAKNGIIFVPLLTSHELFNPALLGRAALACAAFCLTASAVYLLNDLFDLEADRRHETKRARSFASGALPLPAGLLAAPALALAGLALGAVVAPALLGVLALYLVSTTAYSCWLKRVALLDVFVLAGLYTLRLAGGHEATGVAYSAWLLMFSMFIFLSLALVKRHVEVAGLPEEDTSSTPGRGYAARDAGWIAMLGVGSGCLSALVLALYVNSEQVQRLYDRPMLLMFICPLLLFWIGRVWMLAHRGAVHEDPVVFALKDRASYVLGALTLLVVWAAT